MNSKIIVFYDSDCGLCEHTVSFVIKHDKKKICTFSPLNGENAKEKIGEWLKHHTVIDSIVVLEDKNIYYYSKACFRIAWHLKGLFIPFGLLSFLPNFLLYPFDLLYRQIAKRRKGFCSRLSLSRVKSDHPDVFLP